MAEPSVFQKIAGYVGTYAPGIAAILAATGVGAPVAGAVAAIGALAKSFGLPEDTPPEKILSTISADPEIQLKAMLAEQTFQTKMREFEIEELKEYFKDKQGSRQMDVDKTQATGKRDTFLYILAAWCILAPVGIILFLILKGLGTIAADVMLLIGGFLGIIIGEYRTVTSYFFGTTKASQEKTAMIYNSTPNVPKKEV